MAKVTTKTEAKSEVKERRVFLTLTGRSVSYNTPQAFIEEALRLGVSRKVVGASVYPGDVILFGVAPFRLKREEGFTFKPLMFGYSVVKGYAIHARTELGRKVLSATINKLVERGLAEVTDHLDEFVTRRCGYYRISRRVVVHDWDEFVKTFHDLWSRELRSHTDVTAHKTLTHYDFLVQGDFKVIEPYLELPFPVKYTRTLRLIKPDELTLLQNALKERLDTAAVEAFLGERPDQPAVLLELQEYVQQASYVKQPTGSKQRQQQRRRRKVKEQPTHIPEPEPEAPKPETPQPLIDLQPEPQQKPTSNCIHCGKPTTGSILCQECKQNVLNKIKELRGVGASQ